MVDFDVSNFQTSPMPVSVGTPVMLEIRSTTLLDPRTKVVRVLDSRLLTESRTARHVKFGPGTAKYHSHATSVYFLTETPFTWSHVERRTGNDEPSVKTCTLTPSARRLSHQPTYGFRRDFKARNRPDNRGMENHRPAGQPLVVTLFGVPGSGFVGRNVIEPVVN